MAVPRCLSYAIILGSAFVKLPQLLKIWSARNSDGISIVGVILDLISSTLSASYSYANGFAFISWGEYPFLMVVTLGIAYVVIAYQRNHKSATNFAIVYISFVYLSVSGWTSLSILWSAQVLNLPLSISGKILQIVTNYRNGHTGQLSAITCWLMFLGTVIRVFTSIEQTGDPIVIMTFTATSAVNLAIVCQIIYYWNLTNKFLESVNKNE